MSNSVDINELEVLQEQFFKKKGIKEKSYLKLTKAQKNRQNYSSTDTKLSDMEMKHKSRVYEKQLKFWNERIRLNDKFEFDKEEKLKQQNMLDNNRRKGMRSMDQEMFTKL